MYTQPLDDGLFWTGPAPVTKVILVCFTMMSVCHHGQELNVPVPEYPQVTTGDYGGLPEGVPGAGVPWPTVSLNLGEVAGLILEATVPRFADAAAVFVLEGVLAGGQLGGRTAGGQVIARRLAAGLARDGRPVPAPAFPAGEIVAFSAGSPYARCVRSGGPVIFRQQDGQLPEWAGCPSDARAVMSRYGSFLVVPMAAARVVNGFLLFARGPAAPPFSAGDAGQVAGLAARAAGCIASACVVISQQRAAGALQYQPIAASLTGIEVAARCLPAPGRMSGGDWYDVIALPGGRIGLITGDAMGHDQHAAAAMTQLRAAAHALAGLGLPPAEMLRRLDRTAATLQIVPFATCVFAVIDPVGQSCVVAGAGHLPPVIALADGTTSAPSLPSGLPLGLGATIYGQITLPVPSGAVLALYTDGLVDTRTRASEEGVLALRSALAGRHGSLERSCDELLRSLAPHPEDDTTLVLARIPPGYRPSPPPVLM
jgi:hypothetical protein